MECPFHHTILPACAMIRAMARLGINQYGKAETHLVRVYREGEAHALRESGVACGWSDLGGDGMAFELLKTTGTVVAAGCGFCCGCGEERGESAVMSVLRGERFQDLRQQHQWG